jgi:hypothetical protein
LIGFTGSAIADHLQNIAKGKDFIRIPVLELPWPTHRQQKNGWLCPWTGKGVGAPYLPASPIKLIVHSGIDQELINLI